MAAQSAKPVRPAWQRWALAILLVALAVETAVFIAGRDSGTKPTSVRARTSTSVSVAATSTAVASTTPADPDATCRGSFAAATAAATEATKFATITVCTEEQWTRMQMASPIDGATLAGLCNARYGLAATACGTADAERVSREQAAARATTAPRPTAPPATSPRVTVPRTTAPAPPTTRYEAPTTTIPAPGPGKICDTPRVVIVVSGVGPLECKISGADPTLQYRWLPYYPG